MKDLDAALIEILGSDAFYSTDFKVTDNVRKLAHTVNYLFTQLELCKNYMQLEEREYVNEIKENAIKILKTL
jgi:hypothetical protein